MGEADMAEKLPLHPYLTHPHTGCPIQAVGILDSGRLVWPMLGASEDDEGDPGAGSGDNGAGDHIPVRASEFSTADGSFPANTPVAEMTQAQQTAYWKHQSRRHESRVQAYGNRTPEQVAEAFEKAKRQDELEHELSSEADKRERAAREAAQADADAKYRPKLAETAFKVAIGDRKSAEEVAEFIADLNLSRFLTDDGDVDTAKVLARVDQFAPAKGNQHDQQRKGPTVTGHGSGNNGGTGSTGVKSGIDLWNSRNPTRQIATP